MSTGVIIGIAVVVFIIIGGAAWYFLLGPGSKTAATTTTNGPLGNNPTTNNPTTNNPTTNLPDGVTAPRSDWRCGPDYGNAQCGKGNWCSAYGYCGNTDAHKSTLTMKYSNP